MTDFLTIPIIGVMRSPFKEKFGIPRQPNLVEVESYIELKAPYDTEDAFLGIEQFSHLWLLWHFHQNKKQLGFRPQVRPPRLGGNEKIGVFATRSMYRPSPVGLSVVRFERLERTPHGLRLYVIGGDLLDGTPIVDIKPYIQYSDAILNAQSGYAEDTPIIKPVIWQIEPRISKQHQLEIESVLALDPRPAYQDDPTRIYGMRFANYDVRFCVDDMIRICDIQQTEENNEKRI